MNQKLSTDVEDLDRDTETLLEACSEVSQDIVTTVDACLALQPQRKDICKFYMELQHPHILKVIGIFWETHAIDLNPIETLSIVDWSYNYRN